MRGYEDKGMPAMTEREEGYLEALRRQMPDAFLNGRRPPH